MTFNEWNLNRRTVFKTNHMRANAMKKATRRTIKYRKKKLYNKHQAQKLVVVRKKYEKIEDEGENETG